MITFAAWVISTVIITAMIKLAKSKINNTDRA